MNILIAGDGKVGYALSEQLAAEGHDITIIDKNAETLQNTMEALDVMGVQGNGASSQVLQEAGAAEAELLIAATSADELNMLCCLMAKNLGTKHTIARIRNPEYMDQLNLLKEQFGLSMIINPELEAAREIARVVKFSPALRIDTFASGRVELIEFKLSQNSRLAGKTLMQIPKLTDSGVLICAVDRGGKVYIPGGNFQLEAGDHLHITGETRDISAFMQSIGANQVKIRTIMVVGGGRIAYYLARMLDERGFQLKIVEEDRRRCDELCELLPRASIIHADGSDIEVLESEGLDSVDAFVALTGMDEENLIMSMVASYKKVPKIITKTGRFKYMSMMERMGIDTVVNPKLTTTNQIVQYVRAMHNSRGAAAVQTLYKLVDGSAEALEFVANPGTRHLDRPLKDLRLKKNLLIGIIVHGGRVIVPHGRDVIREGDSVIVISSGHRLHDLNDIFADGE